MIDMNFYRLNRFKKSSEEEKNICWIKTRKTTKENMKKKESITLKRKRHVFTEARELSPCV
jgi:hypothetical protein